METSNNANLASEDLIKAEALRGLTGEPSTIDPSGWIAIKNDSLSYNGKLYPSDYIFSVKPANAGLLKYFSTLDENNPMSVQDALLYVVEHHIRVMQGKRFLKPLEVIYEHDRLFFTLLVHQYSGSATNLVVTAKTPSGKDQKLNVIPSSLVFTELSDKGFGYLNSKLGKFEITTKSFGKLIYKPLTCHQSLKLTEFVYKENQEKRKVEPFFIQAAPFFSNDSEIFDPATIYKMYYAKSQDMKFVSLLLEILKFVNVELSLEFNAIDEETKLPFRTPVTSLRGIKNIFTICDISDEL